MDIEFSSLKELYDRLEPALATKVEDLKRQNCKDISKLEVWNYLAQNYWKNAKDLSLYQMVDDILNSSNEAINQYVLNSR